jgi:hypothetical protein
LADLNEGSQRYPELLKIRETVEKMRASDPVRAWDDLP